MPLEHLQRAALYSRYLDQSIFEVSRMISGLFINIDPTVHDYIALSDLDLNDNPSQYAEGELEFLQAIYDDDGDILSGFLSSTELPPLPTTRDGQVILDRLPDNSDHEQWKQIVHKTIFILKPKWLPYVMLDTFQVNDGRWRLLYVFLLKMFGGSDLTDTEMSPGHHTCRYGPCVLLHRDQCRYCLRHGHYGNECWTRRFDSGETAEEIANYQSNKKAKKAAYHQRTGYRDYGHGHRAVGDRPAQQRQRDKKLGFNIAKEVICRFHGLPRSSDRMQKIDNHWYCSRQYRCQAKDTMGSGSGHGNAPLINDDEDLFKEIFPNEQKIWNLVKTE